MRNMLSICTAPRKLPRSRRIVHLPRRRRRSSERVTRHPENAFEHTQSPDLCTDGRRSTRSSGCRLMRRIRYNKTLVGRAGIASYSFGVTDGGRASSFVQVAMWMPGRRVWTIGCDAIDRPWAVLAGLVSS